MSVFNLFKRGCPPRSEFFGQFMTRREVLSLTTSWISSAAIGSSQSSYPVATGAPDITLRIGEITIEPAPRRFVRTVAYNGESPGPVLRAKEGKPLTVEVWNDTNEPEMVHWHGLHIPSDVDGAHDEGTPAVGAHDHRQYMFTPRPAGTRWYHSHGKAGKNLSKTTYSGQLGLFIVEPQNDPGRYDLEVPIILHEWDPYFDQDMDVAYKLFSINGKVLGAGDPIRVRPSQHVSFFGF